MILNRFMAMSNLLWKKICVTFSLGIMFFLSVSILPATSTAQEMSLFSFGKGKIQVKLYSNYFCSACRNLESALDYPLIELTKKNVITITFIDVASSRLSMLYAKYFLYTLNEKKNLESALKTRKILFEASKIPIDSEDKLGNFLRTKGITFKVFDVKPTFMALQNHIRTDRISATPTCIIVNDNKKEIFIGNEDILKGIDKLK